MFKAHCIIKLFLLIMAVFVIGCGEKKDTFKAKDIQPLELPKNIVSIASYCARMADNKSTDQFDLRDLSYFDSLLKKIRGPILNPHNNDGKVNKDEGKRLVDEGEAAAINHQIEKRYTKQQHFDKGFIPCYEYLKKPYDISLTDFKGKIDEAKEIWFNANDADQKNAPQFALSCVGGRVRNSFEFYTAFRHGYHFLADDKIYLVNSLIFEEKYVTYLVDTNYHLIGGDWKFEINRTSLELQHIFKYGNPADPIITVEDYKCKLIQNDNFLEKYYQIKRKFEKIFDAEKEAKTKQKNEILNSRKI